MTSPRRRIIIIALLLTSLTGALALYHFDQRAVPIKVGILHALTGTMAISEQPVVDATLMAIEEINAAGGLLGRPIEPIVVDSRSDWSYAAQQAEALITQQGVDVVFGCWTSACRRTVKPIFERLNSLLIYSVQYEGLEDSPNILYLGATPNQQIIPAVKWSLDNLGKRFYLIGSDYVFPHAANAIIRDQITALHGVVVGEDYILLGSIDVTTAAERIIAANPDVILNTINGDSNIAFFKALRNIGITPDRVPTMSFSISESELQAIGIANMVGNYAAWNYFQSVDTVENRDFVARFKKRYGADRVTNDPIETAYSGVYLWAQAVRDAGTSETTAVRQALDDQSLNTPGGIVSVDPATNQLWKTVRIGRILPSGQFDIVWDSGNPIRPIPYPLSRSPAQWNTFLTNLYTKWHDNWANPGS